MRGKKYLGLAMISALTICLTACGESFPEMTEEEYNQTVEFAVGLLMKYSNNGQAKLTYVDAKELKKQREKEEKKKQGTETTQTVQEPDPVILDTNPNDSLDEAISQPDNNDSNEDTSLNDNAGQDESSDSLDEKDTDTATKDSSKEPEQNDNAQEASSEQEQKDKDKTSDSSDTTSDSGAIVLSSDETQEIIDNIFLSYQGYSVSSSYPESSKSYVINAEKGKKLLVLRFDLYNASSSEKKVNLLEKKITFQVLLNGKNLGYTAVTVLPNDLSSYVGTIEAGAHESLVVLTEIDSSLASEIKNLGMIVTISGQKQTVSLK